MNMFAMVRFMFALPIRAIYIEVCYELDLFAEKHHLYNLMNKVADSVNVI
ncbi:MAG: hypothetical protein R3A12_08230 [Ignavibacteria bacterium]